MSKSDQESHADVQATTAESPSGAPNTNQPQEISVKLHDDRWDALIETNVNAHTEKKNGLTYLSWAWAWTQVLRADPQANFKVEMFNESPLMAIGDSFMVWVTVTLYGKPVTCMLPVLDYRNKPITNPNAFDVNTSIMRCLTKAIAMHGLGLYIYAGEDLPETDPSKEESSATFVSPVSPKAVGPTIGAVMPAKATPKAAPKAAPKEFRTQPTEWDNSDASRRLFADGVIKYASICTSVSDLSNYWLNNQLQLESLKQTHPALFAAVVSSFAEMKKILQG